MAETRVAFVANDNELWLEGVRNSSGTYITSGLTISCTGIARKSDGTAISAGSFPVSITYRTGVVRGEYTDGNWMGLLPAAIALVNGVEYVATITITGDKTARFEGTFTARTRELV